MAIDITEFEGLMLESGVSTERRQHIIRYLNYIIGINKGVGCNFLDSKDFREKAKVVLKAEDSKIYIYF